MIVWLAQSRLISAAAVSSLRRGVRCCDPQSQNPLALDRDAGGRLLVDDVSDLNLITRDGLDGSDEPSIAHDLHGVSASKTPDVRGLAVAREPRRARAGLELGSLAAARGRADSPTSRGSTSAADERVMLSKPS